MFKPTMGSPQVPQGSTPSYIMADYMEYNPAVNKRVGLYIIPYDKLLAENTALQHENATMVDRIRHQNRDLNKCKEEISMMQKDVLIYLFVCK